MRLLHVKKCITCIYSKHKYHFLTSLANSTAMKSSTLYHALRFYVATKEEQHLISAIEDKDTVVVEQLVETARSTLETEIRVFNSTHVSVSESGSTLSNSRTLSHTPPPSYKLQFTTGWVCARMLSRSVEHFEKEGRHSLANDVLRCLLSQTVFSTASRGRWWERLSLNLDHHLGEKEQVRSTLELMYGTVEPLLTS